MTKYKYRFSVTKYRFRRLRVKGGFNHESQNQRSHSRTAALAGATLLIAACGGGSSSSGRQRNSAFCYATEAEKEADIDIARSAFDASFGGNPPPSKSTVPDTSVSIPDSSVPADKTTDSTTADGGGYRRPAIRHFTSVPPLPQPDAAAVGELGSGSGMLSKLLYLLALLVVLLGAGVVLNGRHKKSATQN